MLVLTGRRNSTFTILRAGDPILLMEIFGVYHLYGINIQLSYGRSKTERYLDSNVFVSLPSEVNKLTEVRPYFPSGNSRGLVRLAFNAPRTTIIECGDILFTIAPQLFENGRLSSESVISKLTIKEIEDKRREYKNGRNRVSV